MDVTCARMQEHGWQDWLAWERALAEFRPEKPQDYAARINVLTTDGGELLSFALLAATKRTGATS